MPIVLPERPSNKFRTIGTNSTGRLILLIVEDDPHYCRVLIDLARDKKFKVLVAMRGADALELAKQYQPSAVSLDVFLPDMLGWSVLSQLKQNPLTRHIPVQIITLDEDKHHGLARGAFSFVTKPTTTEGVEAALAPDQGIFDSRVASACLWSKTILPNSSASPNCSAMTMSRSKPPAPDGMRSPHCVEQAADCVVLDLRLPGHVRVRSARTVGADPALSEVPVVVFTGRELSAEEDAQLHTMARSIVVKGVESPERLLDETALFLHRVVTDLPVEKQRMLERLTTSDEDLVSRTVCWSTMMPATSLP